MVPTRVEWQATPAGTHSGGKREPEAAQKKQTERLRIEPAVMDEREAGERQTRHWASLEPEQSTGLEREARPQTRAHKLFFQRHRGDNATLAGALVPHRRCCALGAEGGHLTKSLQHGAWKPASNNTRQRNHQLFCHNRLSFGGELDQNAAGLTLGPLRKPNPPNDNGATIPQESWHPGFVANKIAETR